MNAKALFTNNLGILPQNPQTLFVKKTVELDLYEMLSQLSLTKEEKNARVEAVVKFAELEHLLSMHPYDLSGENNSVQRWRRSFVRTKDSAVG